MSSGGITNKESLIAEMDETFNEFLEIEQEFFGFIEIEELDENKINEFRTIRRDRGDFLDLRFKTSERIELAYQLLYQERKQSDTPLEVKQKYLKLLEDIEKFIETHNLVIHGYTEESVNWYKTQMRILIEEFKSNFNDIPAEQYVATNENEAQPSANSEEIDLAISIIGEMKELFDDLKHRRNLLRSGAPGELDARIGARFGDNWQATQLFRFLTQNDDMSERVDEFDDGLQALLKDDYLNYNNALAKFIRLDSRKNRKISVANKDNLEAFLNHHPKVAIYINKNAVKLRNVYKSFENAIKTEDRAKRRKNHEFNKLKNIRKLYEKKYEAIVKEKKSAYLAKAKSKQGSEDAPLDIHEANFRMFNIEMIEKEARLEARAAVEKILMSTHPKLELDTRRAEIKKLNQMLESKEKLLVEMKKEETRNAMIDHIGEERYEAQLETVTDRTADLHAEISLLENKLEERELALAPELDKSSSRKPPVIHTSSATPLPINISTNPKGEPRVKVSENATDDPDKNTKKGP